LSGLQTNTRSDPITKSGARRPIHSPAARRFASTALRSMLPVVSATGSTTSAVSSGAAVCSVGRTAVEPSRLSSGAGSRRGAVAFIV